MLIIALNRVLLENSTCNSGFKEGDERGRDQVVQELEFGLFSCRPRITSRYPRPGGVA